MTLWKSPICTRTSARIRSFYRVCFTLATGLHPGLRFFKVAQKIHCLVGSKPVKLLGFYYVTLSWYEWGWSFHDWIQPVPYRNQTWQWKVPSTCALQYHALSINGSSIAMFDCSGCNGVPHCGTSELIMTSNDRTRQVPSGNQTFLSGLSTVDPRYNKKTCKWNNEINGGFPSSHACAYLMAIPSLIINPHLPFLTTKNRCWPSLRSHTSSLAYAFQAV